MDGGACLLSSCGAPPFAFWVSGNGTLQSADRPDPMQFNDFEYRLPAVEAVVIVRVKADLIHLFWGAGVGPQTEADIVECNRSSLDAIANEKMIGGAVKDGIVEVNAADWESGS